MISDHISAFHDVVPTIAELLSQPVPAEAEGISFLPTLKGEQQKAHDAIYIEFHRGRPKPEMFSQAVRMGKWKLYKERGKTELFDLEKDPFEKENIAVQHPEIINEIMVFISIMKDDTRLRAFE